MPFSISPAPEEFQSRLEECLEGLEQIGVIADDIIVYRQGDSDEEANVSHDQAFRALLDLMSRASSQTQPQEVETQNAQPRIHGPHPQRSGIGS